MSAALRLLLGLLALALTTGCEVNRVLTIRPDGSGTITERFAASKDAYGENKVGFAPKKDGGEPELTGEIYAKRPSADLVAREAAKFGGGVEVTSYRQIETADKLGYEVTYTFPDVTKLRADTFLNPSGGQDDFDDKANDPARYFQFTRGENPELRVPIPHEKAPETEENAKAAGGKEAGNAKEPAAGAAGVSPSPTPQQLMDAENQRKLARSTNVRIAIRVEGTLLATNSHFRQGNEVVVDEMNLQGMIADPKYAKTFEDSNTAKISSQDDLPPDDRYIKSESVDPLSIRFRASRPFDGNLVWWATGLGLLALGGTALGLARRTKLRATAG